ncbi:hypothetical protein INT47_009807 [Mucor saturninus]|uniref:MULE transposase domain-containing protein n=1 Tax=Mucor saturninus TaxID=64648 RepID=A0A8H7QU21_9FUNG|nr:hypothetical protein INT47_009807 [Mucor saturninus]
MNVQDTRESTHHGLKLFGREGLQIGNLKKRLIARTSNASSVKGGIRLQTFAVAAAFVKSETEDTYQWFLEELREVVWPIETSFKLPSVVVTDNEQALHNAIETVFPESHLLLCSWHLWNTMSTKLAIGKVASVEYNLHIAEAESEFKAMMNSSDITSFRKASDHFQQISTTAGYFKEDVQIALSYLRGVINQYFDLICLITAVDGLRRLKIFFHLHALHQVCFFLCLLGDPFERDERVDQPQVRTNETIERNKQVDQPQTKTITTKAGEEKTIKKP